MQWEQRKEYIEKNCLAKGLNSETRDYITQYVYMNQQLFGNTLNIDMVVDRILNNLNHNITSRDALFNPLNPHNKLLTVRGEWQMIHHGKTHDGKILLNPIHKLQGFIFPASKKRNNSTIMHELDHCATTEFVDISEQEIEESIQYYLEKTKNKNPEFKNNVRNSTNKFYEENGKKHPVSRNKLQ